jgi:putative two-component system response regulator
MPTDPPPVHSHARAPYLLLVEDNTSILDVMRDILESEGYRVSCAANGKEGLRLFERETPDLIVSDVMMPHLDGFGLLKAVRAHPAGMAVPFLFLSARTEQAATTQARLLGADDYLFKPFDPDELTVAVRARLDRRRLVELFDTRTAHLQTVTMLANVIEARDKYTRGHVERVKNYAFDLARALGWSNDALAILEFGALLHDIGKIIVPRDLLNKPSGLLTDEWHQLRQHPEIGAKMLEGVDHLRPAIPYVLYHHERWDGRGYPTGLAGLAIPREGRLLALADTYDAITSDRPYRQALAKEVALAEIRKGGGSQFDPAITEVFVQIRQDSQAGI